MSVYHSETVGAGNWEPLVPEETWRAVHGILEDPARKPPRGVGTLLGGIALCPCGNIAVGDHSHTGQQVYRCNMSTRDRTLPVTHVARVAGPIDDLVRKLVIARMSRDDAADLIARPDNGIDVTALREESTAIRKNLDELAADRALGLIDRAQMLAATERANHRLQQIGELLAEAARENVLAELVAAENVATVWDAMDLSRQRAVIKNLMTITLHTLGRGFRRDFDPAMVGIDWLHDDQAHSGAATN